MSTQTEQKRNNGRNKSWKGTWRPLGGPSTLVEFDTWTASKSLELAIKYLTQEFDPSPAYHTNNHLQHHFAPTPKHQS